MLQRILNWALYGFEEEPQIIDVLNNIYRGTWAYEDGWDIDGDGINDYTVRYDYYEIYDPINDRTYNIQTNMNTEVTPQDIINIFNNMPHSLAKENKKITITETANPADAYWQEFYNDPNFSSAAVGGDDEITIYGGSCLSDIDFAKETIYHETGHNKDNQSDNYYSISGSKEWENAVRLDNEQGTAKHIAEDGTRLITDYAAQAYDSYNGSEGQFCEDFAESLAAISAMGSKWFEEQYPNRSEILKEQIPEMFN